MKLRPHDILYNLLISPLVLGIRLPLVLIAGLLRSIGLYLCDLGDVAENIAVRSTPAFRVSTPPPKPFPYPYSCNPLNGYGFGRIIRKPAHKPTDEEDRHD